MARQLSQWVNTERRENRTHLINEAVLSHRLAGLAADAGYPAELMSLQAEELGTPVDLLLDTREGPVGVTVAVAFGLGNRSSASAELSALVLALERAAEMGTVVRMFVSVTAGTSEARFAQLFRDPPITDAPLSLPLAARRNLKLPSTWSHDLSGRWIVEVVDENTDVRVAQVDKPDSVPKAPSRQRNI